MILIGLNIEIELELKNLKNNKMKKGILILGKSFSGKSRLANSIIGNRKHIILNGRADLRGNRFIYSDCNKDTEVIFIDDLDLTKNNLDSFINAISEGVEVDKKHERSFKINAQIIISICIKSSELPNIHSLARRFEIFQLKNLFKYKI